jgi:hypothetical protein
MRLVKHKNRSPNREWGCPRTKSRTNWCYALCTPKNGIGECGRPAYHAYLGRRQKAILAQRQQEKDLEKRGITPMRREVRLKMTPAPVSWVRKPRP